MGDIADYYRNQEVDHDMRLEYKLKMWPKKDNTTKPCIHKCKDGSKVDVRGISSKYPKMTDAHLLNTIAYMGAELKPVLYRGTTVVHGMSRGMMRSF